MKMYTATRAFHTDVKDYDVRFTFDVSPPRAQTYGQPAEPAEPATVGDISAELRMDGKWHECDGVLHDIIVADDPKLEAWLLEQAAESEQASADDAADHRRELAREDAA